MRITLPFRLAPVALLLLAGCNRHPVDKVWVDHAWVRLAAAPGRPAAAYMSFHGANADARLVSVDTEAAGTSELHESMNRSGPDGGPAVMTMDHIDGVDLPAGQQTDFAPEGYHVMLFGLAPTVKPGGTLPLTIRLAKGDPVRVDAQVIAAGDAAPY